MRRYIFLAMMLASSHVLARPADAKNGAAAAPNPDAALFRKARLAAATGFPDPASAQFRDVRKAHSDGDQALIVCGDINGKNATGGYAGFQSFVYFPASGKSYVVPPDAKGNPEKQAEANHELAGCF